MCDQIDGKKVCNQIAGSEVCNQTDGKEKNYVLRLMGIEKCVKGRWKKRHFLSDW